MNVNDEHYGNDIPEKTNIIHIIEWNCFNKHILLQYSRYIYNII